MISSIFSHWKNFFGIDKDFTELTFLKDLTLPPLQIQKYSTQIIIFFTYFLICVFQYLNYVYN